MNERQFADFGGGTLGGLLAHRAASQPDKEALITTASSLTYGEIDAAATRIAAGLAALGLAKGDAVAIYLRNRVEWVTTWFGLSRAGLICVPVNTAYKGAFLQQALSLTSAVAVVTETALLPTLAAVRPALARLRHVVVADDASGAVVADLDLLTYDELVQKGSAGAPTVHVAPHEPAVISLTSGTTGKSKGVVCSHLMYLTAARENYESMATTPEDRLYTCLPMFHGAAQYNITLHGLYLGATVIIGARFSASRFWDDIRRYNATFFNGLGSVLPMLLAQPPSDQDRDHRVRKVFAAPAPPDVLLPFEARFGVHVIQGYGLSEIKNVTYNRLDHRKVGSIGMTTRTAELQIHDDNGYPLPPGEIGEIVYRPRAPHIMFSGYVNDPEGTLATFRDMWWRTGDLGYVDEDGFYYFVDRKKDAMRRRGENVSSYEVEVVLKSFPEVIDAAAVATPSALGEDDILAVIEVRDAETLDLEALFRHCDEHLPYFMVPRYFRPMTDMPRTPTGKIQKVVLRSEGLADRTWDAVAAGYEPTRLT